MPTEYRELHFSRSELSQALHAYLQMQMPEVTPGSVRIKGVANTPELAVTVQAGSDEVVYNALEVTAALIRFAKKTGVPIPRRAQKALSGRGDGDLTLKLWMD